MRQFQPALSDVDASTDTAAHIFQRDKGQARTRVSMDATVKWFRALGIATVQIELSRWQPNQRALEL